MLKGIIFALVACLIWGLIFVIPQFMTGFSAFEVALGRYSVYGILSILIFFRLKSRRFPLPIWGRALFYSLIVTMGYYIFLVLGLRYSDPAVCTLITGMSPIAIAFYGNWREKEVSFKSLILPCSLIFLGLALINVPHFAEGVSSTYLWGLLFSLFSLAAWSWYVVANSRFLNQHPEVSSIEWSTLMGVVSLVWVAVFALILGFFFEEQFSTEKYFTFGPDLKIFLIGSAILGVFCSWLGSFLWNRASLRLPVSLAGQLTIFETVFGVLFVYILERHLPPLLEGVGIVTLLFAVIYGIRRFAKQQEFTPSS